MIRSYLRIVADEYDAQPPAQLTMQLQTALDDAEFVYLEAQVAADEARMANAPVNAIRIADNKAKMRHIAFNRVRASAGLQPVPPPDLLSPHLQAPQLPPAQPTPQLPPVPTVTVPTTPASATMSALSVPVQTLPSSLASAPGPATAADTTAASVQTTLKAPEPQASFSPSSPSDLGRAAAPAPTPLSIPADEADGLKNRGGLATSARASL